MASNLYTNFIIICGAIYPLRTEKEIQYERKDILINEKEYEMKFRKATREDCSKILFFIKQLAIYEHMENDVVATRELLEEWIFDKKKANVIFALEDGKEVGFALYFYNFSTFLGKAGIYLEDLFVLPEYRGRGYGKGLLQMLASIAHDEDCGRLEWCCLDWNTPSIDFYRSLGAVSLDDWTIYRLTGDTLESNAKHDV